MKPIVKIISGLVFFGINNSPEKQSWYCSDGSVVVPESGNTDEIVKELFNE
jgi:hypothetical protein